MIDINIEKEVKKDLIEFDMLNPFTYAKIVNPKFKVSNWLAGSTDTRISHVDETFNIVDDL